MNNSDFASYKATFRSAVRASLASAPLRSLDEAGFPAYAHPNPAIGWLFWQRLRKAMEFIERGAPYRQALDFGCGSGVMLPFLARHAEKVHAIDVDLEPLQKMKEQMTFPENVEVHLGSASTLGSWPASSIDLITALDVLEHVDDLPGTLNALLRLLTPRAALLVSGPTENLFYKIGRRLAGPEFSGAYHERGIGVVRRQLAGRRRVRTVATLYWPIPLFEIFSAQGA